MKQLLFPASLMVLAASFFYPARCEAEEAAIQPLQKGNHICLIGGTLGERMQHHGHWETLLHQRFPQLNLTVRNLCFPADEVDNRPRSLNFGTPDEHLKHSQADVVMAFFGFNESFAGPQGLSAFRDKLRSFVLHTQSQNYSGRGNARVVLISPIAVEKSYDPTIDVSQVNENLAAYSEAMREVAAETEAEFADVFQPTRDLFARGDASWTLDGFQLNDQGYQKFSHILDRVLFGSNSIPVENAALASEVADKNFHWWHRYRAVNGFSIYGKRGEAGFEGTYNNRDVMERERSILDQMCANRDQRIWKLAQGQSVADQPDDSDTLPFLTPRSNVGTEFENKGNENKRGVLTYLPAREQLKHFQLPDGYVIELVASEEQFPELANPVAINFDSRGRLWVSTMASYPHWKPKTLLDDKLLILEDNDGDGAADVCKTFAGGLHQPTGFELGYGGAFVAVQPDILFLQDTDGDDRADTRVRRVVGFDTADSHHGLGAFEWSPGGTLHCMEGIFKYSGMETLQGPIRAEEGAVWSYRPRLERFGIYTNFGFTNPWGHAFDAWGQDFITDGTSGQHYYIPPTTGHLDFPLRHRGRRDKKGSGIKPYPQFLEKVSRPSPGVEVVSSSNFPEEAQGNYLVNNVIGLLGIMQYSLRPEGSGITGDYQGTLVESTYGNFRPVDCQFGPDGALYICDWQNALIGHLQHNLRDPNRDHSHGRIWRIRYADKPLAKVENLEALDTARLVKRLAASQDRVRYAVRRELAARPTDEVTSAVMAWAQSLDPAAKSTQHELLEALWVLQSHHAIDEDLLRTLLKSSDFRARAAATRVLSDCSDLVAAPLDLVRQQIRDAHPRVRLEAVRACSFFRTPEAAEVALEVLEKDMDVYLEYTLEETMRQLDQL